MRPLTNLGCSWGSAPRFSHWTEISGISRLQLGEPFLDMAKVSVAATLQPAIQSCSSKLHITGFDDPYRLQSHNRRFTFIITSFVVRIWERTREWTEFVQCCGYHFSRSSGRLIHSTDSCAIVSRADCK